MPQFTKQSVVPHAPESVYAWHEKPMAFYRLLPPWENIEVIAPPKAIENGSEVVTRLKWGPFSKQWVSRHYDTIRGRQFCDEQVEGPFKVWRHQHLFEPVAEGTRLIDRIDYELPLGPLGEMLGENFTEHKLQSFFDYRHRVIANDLNVHKLYGTKKMRIAVTGASGLVGSALVPLLVSLGHEVILLSRHKPAKSPLAVHLWSFRSLPLWEKWGIDSLDAVIHLAGENIAHGRWTPDVKRRIETSRTISTDLLAKSFVQLKKRPSVFVCASATGYYASSSELVTENSPRGSNFLSRLCSQWEAAAKPAEALGTRTVNLRIGMVLSPQGGALKKMLVPFSLGVGGMLGDGKHYWSWIALDDLLYAIVHALTTDSLSGPINCVAPESLTNRDFSRTLAAYYGKRLGPTVPAFALKALFGEMADALLLASCRASPQKLIDSGFHFDFPLLEDTLAHVLG